MKERLTNKDTLNKMQVERMGMLKQENIKLKDENAEVKEESKKLRVKLK